MDLFYQFYIQSLKSKLAFPWDTLLGALISVVAATFALSSIWSSALGDKFSTLVGLSSVEYFFLSVCCYKLTFSSFHIIDLEIYEGGLSNKLLYPHSVLSFYLFQGLADFFARLIIQLPVLAFSAFICGFSPNINIIPFFLCAILGFLIHYLSRFIVQLLSFWVEKTDYFTISMMFVVRIFSGETIPLKLLPPFVATLFSFLPFYLIASAPVQVYKSGFSELLRIFPTYLLWFAILGLLASFMIRSGLKTYTARGI